MKLKLRPAIAFTAVAVLIVITWAWLKPFSGSSTPRRMKPDSVTTVIVYSIRLHEYLTGDAIRITRDSLKPDPKDITRNLLQPDTLYYIPVLDSARDANKKAMFDSLHRALMQTYYPLLPAGSVIHDYNIIKPLTVR